MSLALRTLTPKGFLCQLPKVQDLTDDAECPICLEKYLPTKPAAPGIIGRLLSTIAIRREPEPIETEHAVRLPCQHVVGRKCISRWISDGEGNQKTCPYVSPSSLFEFDKSRSRHARFAPCAKRKANLKWCSAVSNFLHLPNIQ